MNKTTTPATQTGRHLASVGTHRADVTEADAHGTPAHDGAHDDEATRSIARRAALRDKHAKNLAKLMEERSDLRGVHPLADFVDDSIRWSA